jgi:hypothetical protein
VMRPRRLRSGDHVLKIDATAYSENATIYKIMVHMPNAALSQSLGLCRFLDTPGRRCKFLERHFLEPGFPLRGSPFRHRASSAGRRLT